MKTNHEWLKNRLQQLDKERDALLTLVAIYKEKPEAVPALTPPGRPVRKRRRRRKSVRVQAPAPKIVIAVEKKVRKRKGKPSITSNVMDAVAELVKKNGKPVGTKQIFEYLETKKVRLGKTKNKKAFLGVLLAQELKKKDGRLKKVDRGVYTIK